MLCDGFASVRYSTIGMRISAVLVMVVGFAYGISLLSDSHDFVTDYIGFMKQGAPATVLPICLVAMCLGCVRFRTFELVRRNPRDELSENVIWLNMMSCMCAAYGGLVFAVMEFVVKRQSASVLHWSLTAMLIVQCLMMNISIGLVQLLLNYMGLVMEHIAAVLIAFFAIAQWLLTPLSDGVARMMFYFWYPISPDWSDIVVYQVIPCFGFCLLLVMACVMAFNSRDRLKN